MDPEVRVLIADDHPIFRQGLRRIIEAEPQFKVVFEAADGEQAVQWLQGSGADVAVLDVTMPVKDAFTVARALREQQLQVPLVLLTMHKDEHYLNAALDLGVQGYVVKDSSSTEIIDCIRAVTAGREYLSPTLSSFLVRRRRSAAALTEQKPALTELTPTERRVLKLVAEGQTSREIAAVLHIGVRTVDHHRNNVALKLELRGSHALLKFAVQHRSELM